MSDLAIDYSKFRLKYVGRCPRGPQGTTRVNLTLEAEEPNVAFAIWLERQCDAQGIQGVLTVIVRDVEEGVKAQLVIAHGVAPAATARLWIKGVNAALAAETTEVLSSFTKTGEVKEAMAVATRDSFAWSGSVGNDT